MLQQTAVLRSRAISQQHTLHPLTASVWLLMNWEVIGVTATVGYPSTWLNTYRSISYHQNTHIYRYYPCSGVTSYGALGHVTPSIMQVYGYARALQYIDLMDISLWSKYSAQLLLLGVWKRVIILRKL